MRVAVHSCGLGVAICGCDRLRTVTRKVRFYHPSRSTDLQVQQPSWRKRMLCTLLVAPQGLPHKQEQLPAVPRREGHGGGAPAPFAAWRSRAARGSCGVTQAGEAGDCERGTRGSFARLFAAPGLNETACRRQRVEVAPPQWGRPYPTNMSASLSVTYTWHAGGSGCHDSGATLR